MDDWAMLSEGDQRKLLQTIARQADGDPWRSQLREALQSTNREELLKLASDDRSLAQLPVTVVLVQQSLETLGQRKTAIDYLRRAQKHYPQHFWINHELGRHLLTAARPEEASSYLQSAVARLPESPSAHNLLGGVYVATQQDANAEREFREALRLDPGFAPAHQNLAFILHLRRKYLEALAFNVQAVRYASEDADAHLAQGNALILQGRIADASAAFKKALQLAPSDWIVNDGVMSSVRSQGLAGAFESQCRQSLKDQPNDPNLHRLLAEALYQQRKFSEAETAFREALLREPNNHLALCGLAGLLLDDNRTDQAELPSRQVVRVRPDFAWGHVCLAAVLRRQGRSTDAEASLRQAIELEPYNYFQRMYLNSLLREQNRMSEALAETRKGMSFRLAYNAPFNVLYRDGKWLSMHLASYRESSWFPSPRGSAEVAGPSSRVTKARTVIQQSPNSSTAHVELAWALKNSNQYAEAEAMARQAIRLRENNGAAWVCLGFILSAQRKFEDAERLLQQALKLKSDDAKAHEGLVMVLEHQGKHDQADESAREAVRLDPNEAQNHHHLAWLAAKRGDLEVAEASYKEELKRRPERAWSHQDLGWVLHRRGKREEAKQEFDQARKLDSSFTHFTLGHGYAMTGLWWQAEQHYLAAMREEPEVNRSGLRAALLLLLRGERAEYEAVCKAMKDRFAETKDESAARRTVQACLTAQLFVGDLEAHRQLLEAAVGADEDPFLVPRERSLLAYRAGDWEMALAECSEARAINASSRKIASYDAQSRLIESLALHRLNRNDEARACYYEAARKAYLDFPYAPHSPGGSWADWVFYEILRREAAGALGIPNPTIDPEAYDRAWVAARQGDWNMATREFLVACEAPHSNTLQWNFTASALLMANDVAGYRQHCQTMRKRFAASDAWEDSERVCKTSVMSTEGLDLASLPVDRFTKPLEDGTSPTGFIPWGYATWSIVAYRSGDWHKAAETAKQAITADPNNRLTHMDGLFVGALANHRLGNREESLRLLKQANEMSDADLPRNPDGSLDAAQIARGIVSWYDALVVEILRKEANALIAPGDAGK
jgi:tetratricopeptide (TPR) repeat protein